MCPEKPAINLSQQDRRERLELRGKHIDGDIKYKGYSGPMNTVT